MLVEVWTLDASEVRAKGFLADAASLLPAAERDERERGLDEATRVEAIVSRALLRTTLSRHAPVDPRAWSFDRSTHGRPIVTGPRGAPSFNVSHSRGFVACAIGDADELGLDVEDTRRPIAIDSTARVSFSPDELAGLFALDGDARRARFFALWTLKEAYLKARGAGLTMPLDRFSLRLDGPAPTISFAPDFGDVPDGWAFARPDLGAPISAAIAARGPGAATLDVVVRRLAPSALRDRG